MLSMLHYKLLFLDIKLQKLVENFFDTLYFKERKVPFFNKHQISFIRSFPISAILPALAFHWLSLWNAKTEHPETTKHDCEHIWEGQHIRAIGGNVQLCWTDLELRWAEISWGENAKVLSVKITYKMEHLHFQLTILRNGFQHADHFFNQFKITTFVTFIFLCAIK